MYQAIITKFVPATNHRGSRVKATAQFGSVTIGWDHALNIEENHEQAAIALATKWGWLSGRKMVSGATDGGFAFVLVNK